MLSHDGEGSAAAQTVQQCLLEHKVWVWPIGCIEQITGFDGKGEEAIVAQEKVIRSMDAHGIVEVMPLFKECFEWVDQL